MLLVDIAQLPVELTFSQNKMLFMEQSVRLLWCSEFGDHGGVAYQLVSVDGWASLAWSLLHAAMANKWSLY